MAKKSRATFQKREKERARQQKQHAKVQRRLAAKEMRTSNPTQTEDDELVGTDINLEPDALPASWDEEPHPADQEAELPVADHRA